MIGIGGRSAIRGTMRLGSVRGLSLSRVYSNIKETKSATPILKPETTPIKIPVAPQTPKKKKFSLLKFLFQATLITAVVYGGTLYVATKNEKVMDFVIDQQLPYYEELVELIEKGSIDDIKAQFESLLTKASQFKLPSKDQIDELTQKLENQGEHLIEETRKKLSKAEAKQGTDALPAQQLQEQVEVEAVQKKIKPLPLVKLAGSSIDNSVKATIESFNDFISSIDAAATVGKNDTLIKSVSDNIASLSKKLDSLTKNFDEELQSKLKVSQTELLSSYTKKELELTENFLHQFNEEKSRLEGKLNQRLKREIDAAKETISQAAVNAVSMVRIDQTKKFETLIKEKIDQERSGRLANLDNLISRLNNLEAFSTSLEKQLSSNHQKSLIQASLSKVKTLLFAADDSKPKLIASYIDSLTKVSQDSNDELLKLALQNLTPLVAKESNKSILTNAQLLARWEQLAPELRSASLLPPNAGLLGHLSALIFSKLLLPVKGSKPNGKDIESVIGRVEQSLTRGDLDIAVEEAANLKGWSRELARDWVNEGRKRLEAEFLVSLIDAEAKIL